MLERTLEAIRRRRWERIVVFTGAIAIAATAAEVTPKIVEALQ